MFQLTHRAYQGVILLLAGLVLFGSLYLQYREALEPCPLCLMQRAMTALLFITAFSGLWVKVPTKARLTYGLEWLWVIAGIFFASRQIYLEHMPLPDTGMCLPGIEVLIQKLPLDELIHAFIWGHSSGCGEVTWRFLGLSMASWSLIYFFITALILLGARIYSNDK